jgi:hypothetical protein
MNRSCKDSLTTLHLLLPLRLLLKAATTTIEPCAGYFLGIKTPVLAAIECSFYFHECS